MKKLILFFACAVALVTACAQPVKISAMPLLTDAASIKAGHLPIVYNLINYRVQASYINKDRIDSIVTNWPVAAEDRFGKSGQDVLAAENRSFDGASTYRLTFTNIRVQEDLGASIAAANNLTLGADGNAFTITGSTQINAITTANWQAGSVVRLIFTGTPLVKHNTAGGAGTAVLQLAGAVDYTAAANDVMTLVYDGTDWHETSRKLSGVAPGATRFGVEDNTATQNRTYTMGSNTFAWTINSLSADGITISSTSTTVNNGSKAFEVEVSGANTVSAANTYAIYGKNSRTGTTNTSIGVYGEGAGRGVEGVGTTSGTGVRGSSTSGTGVIGNSTSGLGLWGISSSNTAVNGSSTTGTAFDYVVSGTATTNAVAKVGEISIQTSGTAANGFGGYYMHNVETDNPNTEAEAARVNWWLYDVTQATAAGAWGISTNADGATGDVMRFDIGTGNGNVRVLTAGKGFALTSPDGTIYYGTISNAGVLSWSTTIP